MKKWGVIIVTLFVCFSGYSKTIRVGLFEKRPVRKITIKHNIGRYQLFSQSKKFSVLQDGNTSLTFKVKNGKVQAFKNGELLGDFIWFRLNKLSENNSLRLYPYGKPLKYRGDIILYANAGFLQVVNEIDMEQYVQGAIKGEVGYGYGKEYYKVQAVISRTYALFLQKHSDEGFDLCDHTHCQVYKGVNYDKNIEKASAETKGEVIVRQDLKSINTLFHSNCGGQTVTTDFVWSKKLENLDSHYDPYCRKSSQANWKKTILKEKWNNYLSNELNVPLNTIKNSEIDFLQSKRKKYYLVADKKIKLTRIRSYFRLKSTFFSVHSTGDKVVVMGRGFGHGVGLCQEGAIAMSKKGFSHKQVLKFYYRDVYILNQEDLGYYNLF